MVTHNCSGLAPDMFMFTARPETPLRDTISRLGGSTTNSWKSTKFFPCRPGNKAVRRSPLCLWDSRKHLITTCSKYISNAQLEAKLVNFTEYFWGCFLPYTLPETNGSEAPENGWERNMSYCFPLRRPIFRDKLAVSFKEGGI